MRVGVFNSYFFLKIFGFWSTILQNTPSIPNCKSFDFFYPKFDHSSYSKNLCKYSQILSYS